jgi:hypothetical protein
LIKELDKKSERRSRGAFSKRMFKRKQKELLTTEEDLESVLGG